MIRRRAAIAVVQVALAAAYVVWIMSNGMSHQSIGLGLFVPAAILGTVLLVTEIEWRRRRPVDTLAHVGRLASWGAFVVAASFAAISVLVYMLVPDLTL